MIIFSMNLGHHCSPLSQEGNPFSSFWPLLTPPSWWFTSVLPSHQVLFYLRASPKLPLYLECPPPHPTRTGHDWCFLCLLAEATSPEPSPQPHPFLFIPSRILSKFWNYFIFCLPPLSSKFPESRDISVLFTTSSPKLGMWLIPKYLLKK